MQISRKALYAQDVDREKLEAIFENVFGRFEQVARATHPAGVLPSTR